MHLPILIAVKGNSTPSRWRAFAVASSEKAAFALRIRDAFVSFSTLFCTTVRTVETHGVPGKRAVGAIIDVFALKTRAHHCRVTIPRMTSHDYLKKILTARVYDVARETELEPARNLSARLRNPVYLKREDNQPVFSFKVRGAYNKMAHICRRSARARRDHGVGGQSRAGRGAVGGAAGRAGDHRRAGDDAAGQGRCGARARRPDRRSRAGRRIVQRRLRARAWSCRKSAA